MQSIAESLLGGVIIACGRPNLFRQNARKFSITLMCGILRINFVESMINVDEPIFCSKLSSDGNVIRTREQCYFDVNLRGKQCHYLHPYGQRFVAYSHLSVCTVRFVLR